MTYGSATLMGFRASWMDLDAETDKSARADPASRHSHDPCHNRRVDPGPDALSDDVPTHAGSVDPDEPRRASPVARSDAASRSALPLPFDPAACPEFTQRYLLEGVLGRGGMGVVYRGVQLALSRPVAIKFVLSPSESFRARFHRERQVTARLSHPNIVQVHDGGEVGGVPYLVMELVDGLTLRELLDGRGGRLPLTEALNIARQMLDGLEYVHARSAIHRDIKPANTFVTSTGLVKLGDFGLAWAEDLTRLTGTAEAMGTPVYMPPEQFFGSATQPSADLYALASVLYELVTGRLPMEQRTFAELVVAHRANQRPKPIRSLDAGLPVALEQLLVAGLEKDPALRPSSAARFRSALEAVTGQGADPIVRLAGTVDRADPEPCGAHESEGSESDGVVVAVCVLILVVGMAAAGWLYSLRMARTPVWPASGRTAHLTGER